MRQTRAGDPIKRRFAASTVVARLARCLPLVGLDHPKAGRCAWRARLAGAACAGAGHGVACRRAAPTHPGAR